MPRVQGKSPSAFRSSWKSTYVFWKLNWGNACSAVSLLIASCDLVTCYVMWSGHVLMCHVMWSFNQHVAQVDLIAKTKTLTVASLSKVAILSLNMHKHKFTHTTHTIYKSLCYHIYHRDAKAGLTPSPSPSPTPTSPPPCSPHTSQPPQVPPHHHSSSSTSSSTANKKRVCMYAHTYVHTVGTWALKFKIYIGLERALHINLLPATI